MPKLLLGDSAGDSKDLVVESVGLHSLLASLVQGDVKVLLLSGILGHRQLLLDPGYGGLGAE